MLLIAATLVVSLLLASGAPIPTPEEASPETSPPTVQPTALRPIFEPLPVARPAVTNRGWVASHVETALWTSPTPEGEAAGAVRQWGPLHLTGEVRNGLLPVWDPLSRQEGWVHADDVGPIDPAFLGTSFLPPVEQRLRWSGAALITKYTCVELGGCAATASGLWPEPGMVAVDPAVIPLGSKVWVQGLGTFVATDTGSLVRGAHLDVFSLSYADALDWGVQQRAVFVFERE